MVERRQVSHATAPPTPAAAARPTLDRDGVMLILAARERALRPLPAPAVRVTRAGEDARQFVVGRAPVAAASSGVVCDFLDVPASFMRRAPLDLANKIAARMLRDDAVADRELVHNAATNTVVGYRPRGTRFVPASGVFERVFAALPPTDGIYLHETDRAVEASIVCRSLDIEPRVGDVVRGGLSCLYSEIDAKRASIRAYSERLFCTNGMTHREFERDHGAPDDLGDFLAEIDSTVLACCEYVSHALQPEMTRAAEFSVNGPQAIRRIFKQQRLPTKLLDAVLAAHVVEDDGTAYGVLQAFTRAVVALKHDARVRLQAVAGDELVAIEAAHCPTCYAPVYARQI